MSDVYYIKVQSAKSDHMDKSRMLTLEPHCLDKSHKMVAAISSQWYPSSLDHVLFLQMLIDIVIIVMLILFVALVTKMFKSIK